MYRILIVDDEELIRKGIAAKIKYNNFDICEVYEAGDGREALQIIAAKQPHIIITDIRMPHMDGIELIRQTKEVYPDIKFIIISGYAEFSYAEQALNMGVSGYILKPIGNDDFVKSMTRVLNDLDNEKKIKEVNNDKEMLKEYYDNLSLEQKLNQIFHSVKKENNIKNTIENVELNNIDVNSKYALSIVNIDGSSYYQSDFKYQDLELLKFGLTNIFSEIDTECTKFIINNMKDKNQILILFAHPVKNILKINSDRFLIEAYNKATKYLNISMTCGLSGIEDILDSELYRQAKEAFDLRIIYGSNRIYKYESTMFNSNFVVPQNEIKLLQKCIERYDIGNIEIILNDIFSDKNFKGMSGAYVRFIWLEITNMLIKVCSELNLEIGNTLGSILLSEEVLDRFDSISEIISYLYTTIVDIFNLENVVDMNSKNKIKMAVQYIEQHYQEEISVNDLAYKFAINPNYFSTIFKKEKGHTVINYLTDVRISNACRLLTETQASVVDIAKSVGYEDPQYFYRVFRKIIGKTPLEYRKCK